MTLAILLIIFAAAALVFILRLTVLRSLQPVSDQSLTPAIQPIDMESFRNLINPSEADFLRRRLPAAEFRTVQRQRLRATAAYIQAAGRNAAILVRVGQTALASSDPQTAEAARQLVDNALLLRRNAALALLRIYVALAWPASGLSPTPVLLGYERLSGSAMLLGRLQNPATPVRIAGS